jgi:hypothetical protein
LESRLYKIVYCSRSEIRGTGEEVATALLHLLESAQARNRRFDITGALLFYSGVFAQTLEGPQSAVERLFSRIEQDERNSEVTVAFRGPEAERDFPGWSMGFADGEKIFADGEETSRLSMAKNAIHGVFAKQEGAGEELLALLKILC